jgi:hypothetical protein
MRTDGIHSIVSLDVDDHFLLFGKKHIFKLSVVSQKVEIFENVRVQSILSLDQKNFYAIIHKNSVCKHTQHSGVKFLNIQALVEKSELQIFNIETTIVARNNQFDFSAAA